MLEKYSLHLRLELMFLYTMVYKNVPLYEHVYSHRGNIKTVKIKITIKEKERKKIPIKMK